MLQGGITDDYCVFTYLMRRGQADKRDHSIPDTLAILGVELRGVRRNAGRRLVYPGDMEVVDVTAMTTDDGYPA